MNHVLRAFRAEEDGNSTVDWIVLTAGIMLLSSAVFATVVGGGTNVASASSDVIAIQQTERAL